MSKLVRQGTPAPGVAVLTLDRPAAMNALNRQLRKELTAAIDGLAKDECCKVIILTGSGKAFCAGIDLKELSSDTSLLVPDRKTDPVQAIVDCPKPVIAHVNGAAITGGFELALACDIRTASEVGCFRDSHGQVGALPGWGLSQRLSRLVGLGRAMEVSLTGRFVHASEALDWGLVNAISKPAEPLGPAIHMASAIAAAAPGFADRLKHMIVHGYGMPLERALAWENAEAAQFNAAVSGDEIADRREGVLRTGRSAIRMDIAPPSADRNDMKHGDAQ